MAGVRAVIVNERGEICCVRHAYGARDWNVPGGGIEQNESLLAAVCREVLEETGFHVRVEFLVGLYSIPANNDLVALFMVTVQSQGTWSSGDEVSEVAFVPPNALPKPIHPCVVRCLRDAIEGRRGIVRVLNPDGTDQAMLDPST